MGKFPPLMLKKVLLYLCESLVTAWGDASEMDFQKHQGLDSGQTGGCLIRGIRALVFPVYYILNDDDSCRLRDVCFGRNHKNL